MEYMKPCSEEGVYSEDSVGAVLGVLCWRRGDHWRLSADWSHCVQASHHHHHCLHTSRVLCGVHTDTGHCVRFLGGTRALLDSYKS